ncbi:helix-turn-helix domain-containing protein [Streptomyces europaeiscabiei]|uniref:helix-turn-helix domain-containing protein n=1 Tax=Streptomyces europaeiscabiei TaxID=146819 RepID=UPI0029B66F6F|nr:helix-turn-helix domain-containing protein [Streptomyces europaeiscabiei]MDX3636816.1 helix-turn-helix domain-containing protein [Streptomyces europaeiscabiei]MDX3655041.1 helix-turn-helix domain-containing protein [Streptomyces europaeiscabiei]
MPSWDARQEVSVSSQDEVEEFAALLRRLKARTDRSYAALAQHLNMNASTLHRYCAGDAVPLGFASVERFAAMCKASPAERIELHRRWVLAAAARQRSRTTTGSAPEAAGAPSAGSEGPLADGAAELVSSVAADSVSMTATDSVAATAVDSVPGPLPGPLEPLAESLPDSSREHDAASRRASRKPWYRHRVAVTAALATALIATLGSLSSLPSGRSSATADDRTSGTTTAGARQGSPSPSAPASPTRGRPPGTPSPKAPPTDDHSSNPSTSPSLSPYTSPSAKAVPAVPPLTWTVNSQLWASGCDHDYIIDRAPQQVPPPPAPQDATPWARTQGAVHGGQTLVDISVQGRTDAAVVLEALRVRVVGRATPVKGTVYFTGQGCGADLDPRSFAVNLDMDQPIARTVQGGEGSARTPAVRMPYRVTAKDPKVLMVDARTVDCDCLWYLELDWSSQGRTGTERIDDHGLPFRTSGTKGLPQYWYAHDGWTPLAS